MISERPQQYTKGREGKWFWGQDKSFMSGGA